MKIEIQASGDDQEEIANVVSHLADRILLDEPQHWHVRIGTSQASAVVVQEEKEGE